MMNDSRGIFSFGNFFLRSGRGFYTISFSPDNHDLSGAAQDLEKNTRATPAGQSHSNNKNYDSACNIFFVVTFFLQSL